MNNCIMDVLLIYVMVEWHDPVQLSLVCVNPTASTLIFVLLNNCIPSNTSELWHLHYYVQPEFQRKLVCEYMYECLSLLPSRWHSRCSVSATSVWMYAYVWIEEFKKCFRALSGVAFKGIIYIQNFTSQHSFNSNICLFKLGCQEHNSNKLGHGQHEHWENGWVKKDILEKAFWHQS